MSKLKFIAILTTAFVLLVVMLFATSTSTPLLAQDRGDTGSSGGSSGGGGGGGGSSGGDAPTGEIRGVLTNLTSGQPADGVEISVNGAIIRTDAAGKWTITGLPGGTYTVVVIVPAGFATAQPSSTVNLPGGGLITLDLQIFEGSAPVAATAVPTVAPTVEPTAEATPAVSVPDAPGAESPPELPDAGGVFPDADLPLEQFPLLMADAQTVLPLSDAQNILVPAMSRALPAVLCNNIYIVEGGDVLANIADFFLGSSGTYHRIVEATNASRVENPVFSEITNPAFIRPGNQLCIPAR